MVSSMNKPAYLATLLLTGALSLSALGIEEAAQDEALGTVDGGVALFRAECSDAGRPATSLKQGPIVDRDSHSAVHGLHHKCLAQGAEAGQAGRDPSGLTDANRKTLPKTVYGERLRESQA
jgi:hypothetical protein